MYFDLKNNKNSNVNVLCQFQVKYCSCYIVNVFLVELYLSAKLKNRLLPGVC